MKIQLKSILSVVICGFVLLLEAPYASAQTLNEIAKLLDNNGTASDVFGNSVAVDGDTAVIGAPQADGNVGGTGAAFVFLRSAGVWTEQAKLTASDADALDDFGRSVSVSGDTAVVGAVGDDDNGNLSGSAYVFVRTGSTWTEQAKPTASDGAVSD